VTAALWVDLTPNLKNNPQQVDLLAQANNQCFLASLGSTTQLQRPRAKNQKGSTPSLSYES